MNAERVFVKDIDDRALQYAGRAAKLFRHLTSVKDELGLILARQYFRSATSIGANLSEAQSGETRKDFIHKCSIAQKEARESHYWLKVMSATGVINPTRLDDLLQETNEIIAVITAIIRNSKRVK
jgi:four helix bundle protein